ncbi:MAG: class I SAM-dependent methyltransferase [Candidatus Eremiobacterota bacterium]
MTDVTQFFNEQQVLYRKLVSHDHLGHAEFFRALARLFEERFDRPVRLLDLGCGDASVAAQLPFGSYEGVDRSEAALDEARKTMQGRDARFSLGDLLSRASGDLREVDVVLASCSVHHLSRDEKVEFLKRLARGLSPGACLAMLDVLRREGESREEYLQRFFAYTRREWASLTEREHELVEEHMGTSDFPEPLSFWQKAAPEAGFARLETVREDPHRSQTLLAFWR